MMLPNIRSYAFLYACDDTVHTKQFFLISVIAIKGFCWCNWYLLQQIHGGRWKRLKFLLLKVAYEFFFFFFFTGSLNTAWEGERRARKHSESWGSLIRAASFSPSRADAIRCYVHVGLASTPPLLPRCVLTHMNAVMQKLWCNTIRRGEMCSQSTYSLCDVAIKANATEQITTDRVLSSIKSLSIDWWSGQRGSRTVQLVCDAGWTHHNLSPSWNEQ